jgi:hypothetical protein
MSVLSKSQTSEHKGPDVCCAIFRGYEEATFYVKVAVKIIFIAIIMACTSVVLSTPMDEKVGDVYFQNWCFLITLLLLLPNAYQAGVSVRYWLSKSGKSFRWCGKCGCCNWNEDKQMTREQQYRQNFAGCCGWFYGVIFFFVGFFCSPLILLYAVLFRCFKNCKKCCAKDTEKLPSLKQDLYILIAVLDAWQVVLLLPLAFIILRKSERNSDALINTVAMQFLATLEDTFIEAFSDKARLESYVEMAKMYEGGEVEINSTHDAGGCAL